MSFDVIHFSGVCGLPYGEVLVKTVKLIVWWQYLFVEGPQTRA